MFGLVGLWLVFGEVVCIVVYRLVGFFLFGYGVCVMGRGRGIVLVVEW